MLLLSMALYIFFSVSIIIFDIYQTASTFELNCVSGCESGLSGGAIAGIVIGVLFGTAILAGTF